MHKYYARPRRLQGKMPKLLTYLKTYTLGFKCIYQNPNYPMLQAICESKQTKIKCPMEH